jgi:hypothetical protein
MSRSLTVIASAVLLLGATATSAQPPNVPDVSDSPGKMLMQRSEAHTKSRTEVAQYRMDLIESDGTLIQSRVMRFNFKRLDGAENTLLRFEAPAALQGTGLLVVDKGRQVNDLWLYLPATRRVRRLAGAEKTNRFLGTEFTHEDFEDYKVEHYRFDTPRETGCPDGGQCWVVDAQAQSAEEREASGYAGKTFWLEKESLYPVLIEYRDRDGQAVKRLEARNLVRHGKYWRPTEFEMINLASKRRTLLVVQKRDLDTALDDDALSQRALRSD